MTHANEFKLGSGRADKQRLPEPAERKQKKAKIFLLVVDNELLGC